MANSPAVVRAANLDVITTSLSFCAWHGCGYLINYLRIGMQIKSILQLILAAGSFAHFQAPAATANRHYYAHDAVVDSHGVIAPWYKGLNGQCDFRVRIAAETLKRYPWTTTNTAIAAYPDYVFSGQWQITSNGVIIPKTPSDWDNGDIGQRSVSVLMGMVDYYRYSADPAAIAHLTYMGDFLLDYCQTPPDHPWPSFLISVPIKGKEIGRAHV